jgi:hypothetical protein
MDLVVRDSKLRAEVTGWVQKGGQVVVRRLEPSGN